MKASLLLAFRLAVSPALSSQSTPPEGILQSIHNATVTPSGDSLTLTPQDSHTPIEISFTSCTGLGLQRDNDQWWLLPISAPGAHIAANNALWLLPLSATSPDRSWRLELHGGTAVASKTDTGITLTVTSGSVTLSKSEPRPHSDPFGNRFSLQIDNGPELENALAGFYWGTILPSVVEKTLAANFPYSSGYVLSTLNVNAYAGSYPAVDHEFQIKGRLAIGSDADIDVVRRMIELQFKLMDDDPEHLFRAPTSVQPDGRREYHVRRSSINNHENAAMFPLTGNIEVLEEAWHLYTAHKDIAWLRANILNLEHAAGWTQASIDQYGRVWGDVYYEDQVMKDGRETEAQAFAAYTFGLLARMETALARPAKAAEYQALSKKIAHALIQPLPMGYWDEQNQRFIDWVDRNGQVHDHVALLGNTLPVTFSYATPAQAAAVRRLVQRDNDQFERFPSFLSSEIASYTKSEIGDGGPYDLCAAGRYWYWDAAFRNSEKQSTVLRNQLLTVAREAAKDNYLMGERYDMDYVYYVDGKNAHGAEKYYEYPNVFAAVLIEKFLGLTVPADADLTLAPQLDSFGTIDLAIPRYALRYTWDATGFTLKNTATRPRRFQVDLSAISHGTQHYRLSQTTTTRLVGTTTTLTLQPGQQAHWSPAQ